MPLPKKGSERLGGNDRAVRLPGLPGFLGVLAERDADRLPELHVPPGQMPDLRGAACPVARQRERDPVTEGEDFEARGEVFGFGDVGAFLLTHRRQPDLLRRIRGGEVPVDGPAVQGSEGGHDGPDATPGLPHRGEVIHHPLNIRPDSRVNRCRGNRLRTWASKHPA
jgi:hypothetical protein